MVFQSAECWVCGEPADHYDPDDEVPYSCNEHEDADLLDWSEAKKEKEDIRIAESFYSVQGEGPYAGTPAFFVRLAGCNLSCGLTESTVQDFEQGQDPEGDATWICDTIDVWREADEVLPTEEYAKILHREGIVLDLDYGAHLVFTGGEPLIKSNRKAIKHLYLDIYNESSANPFVEVETNGTLIPDSSLVNIVDQWNVSIKLENSGMSEERRINEGAIEAFRKIHNRMEDRDATFKFVVSEHTDIYEILSLQDEIGFPDSMISLMPAGASRDELQETSEKVAEICKDMRWRYSPRLQIDIWNQATGV